MVAGGHGVLSGWHSLAPEELSQSVFEVVARYFGRKAEESRRCRGVTEEKGTRGK